MDLAALFQLISTGGALAFALWLLNLLIKEELVPKGRLDDQKALTREALDGWKTANSANERLADAWEARNAAEAKLADTARLVAK
jgi:hypothetical protein